MEQPGLQTAIVYDFDGTLAPGNCQEHGLFRLLGVDADSFWRATTVAAEHHDADRILLYLRQLIDVARERGTPLTAALLEAQGRAVPFFDGVEAWFDRIDAHAAERGLRLEHYLISSGNEEILRGTSIARHFRRIFACRYLYDDQGHASWPAVAINYTTKTQFLFRINKGIGNAWDDEAVNRWLPMAERDVPFSRMIYVGDGDTDIPSMKMVRHQGGHSVAVFDPERWSAKETQRKVYNLIAEDRAHFVVPADYRDGSQLDVTIKGILGRLARDQAGYREPRKRLPSAELDPERRVARRRLDADRAAVSLGHRLRDRQPEPGAAAIAPRREEAIEQARAVVSRDARAVVVHRDARHRAARSGIDVDGARRPREAICVLDQVRQR